MQGKAEVIYLNEFICRLAWLRRRSEGWPGYV